MTQSSIFSNVCLQVVVPVALSVSFFLSSDLKKNQTIFYVRAICLTVTADRVQIFEQGYVV
jgi:hypothetical protein